uniref:GDSL esterase/lipase n=1 Tax=Oryza glumipatula TaxID=40148 RepID=A0A0D9Y5E2_9ORYZ
MGSCLPCAATSLLLLQLAVLASLSAAGHRRYHSIFNFGDSFADTGNKPVAYACFGGGANFAVAGATALDAGFFHDRDIPGAGSKFPLNTSLDVQLAWFESLTPSLCGTAQEADEARGEEHRGPRDDPVRLLAAGADVVLRPRRPGGLRRADGVPERDQRASVPPQVAAARRAARAPVQAPRRRHRLRRFLPPRHGDGGVSSQIR